jgi:hypothetical protein
MGISCKDDVTVILLLGVSLSWYKYTLGRLYHSTRFVAVRIYFGRRELYFITAARFALVFLVVLKTLQWHESKGKQIGRNLLILFLKKQHHERSIKRASYVVSSGNNVAVGKDKFFEFLFMLQNS